MLFRVRHTDVLERIAASGFARSPSASLRADSRPAAEMVRFGLAVLCFAHRAFCASLILRLPAADIVPLLRPATALGPVPCM